MKTKSLKGKYIFAVILAFVVLILDRATKTAVDLLLQYEGKSVSAIKGILNFTYVKNSGAAFGIMQGQRVLFTVLTLAVFVAVIWYFKKFKPQSMLEFAAAALILAGAAGNLADRLRFGYVRDFIDLAFMDFPVFNVADCAICVGAGLVVLYALLDLRKSEDESAEVESAEDESKDVESAEEGAENE
ncbi:MAG: signal peptidase II [Clostridia bacterium]|nr:signal peptidase II [Clostridia bacterium]